MREGTRLMQEIAATAGDGAFLDTTPIAGMKEHGAGTPRELAAGTAAPRNAGVIACDGLPKRQLDLFAALHYDPVN